MDNVHMNDLIERFKKMDKLLTEGRSQEDVELDGEEISEMWGQIGSDYPSGLGKDLNKAMRFFEHMTNSLADAKKYLNKAISGKKYAPQAKNAIDELNNISGYAKTAQRKIEKAFSKV